MNIVNIAEAKAHLSKLIDLALQGKEIVIGKRNTPLVRLSVINPQTDQKRQGGHLKGKIHIDEDFDMLPEDLQNSFEGRDT